MRKGHRLLAASILPCLAGIAVAAGESGVAPPPSGTHRIERRREQFSKDFAYFVYPIAGKVPGLGSAVGGGATVANLKKTNLDLTGFYINGDFKATGLALTDLHVVPERVVLNFGS